MVVKPGFHTEDMYIYMYYSEYFSLAGCVIKEMLNNILTFQ